MTDKKVDKPDFDKLAKQLIGTSTTYGRCDAPIGSSLRSYYETEIKGSIKGMVYIWDTYVTPLNSELKKKDEEIARLKEILIQCEAVEQKTALILKNQTISTLKSEIQSLKEEIERLKAENKFLESRFIP